MQKSNNVSMNVAEIDLDSLDHGLTISQCSLANHAARELIRRLREAERDAARYRWVRDNSPLYGGVPLISDSAVDELMSKESEQKPVHLCMGKPKSECQCPDCGPSIIDLKSNRSLIMDRANITLTAKQLREALEYANPNGPEDEETEGTEVVIEWMPERISSDGDLMPAGLYLWYVDCPEEGVIGPLGESNG